MLFIMGYRHLRLDRYQPQLIMRRGYYENARWRELDVKNTIWKKNDELNITDALKRAGFDKLLLKHNNLNKITINDT